MRRCPGPSTDASNAEGLGDDAEAPRLPLRRDRGACVSRLHGVRRRVCVAVDDDPRLVPLLHYATKLMVKSADEVQLIHVAQPRGGGPGGFVPGGGGPGGLAAGGADPARALLRRAAGVLLRTGWVQPDQVWAEVLRPARWEGVGRALALHCLHPPCSVLLVGRSSRLPAGPAHDVDDGEYVAGGARAW